MLILSYRLSKCNAITNTSFNASDRIYAVNNASNLKYVKTLQKEEIGKRTFFIPAGKPAPYKEVPDNTHSGTSDSHSRGLLYNEHQGYGLNDYEEGSHYSYGHDYQFQEHHQKPHSPHVYEHHDYEQHHYPGHNYDHGHYKYEKHVLAAKAALWPLAGIALLGAAALAVSNPVLLQLGVVSGKRRKRDTEEITGPDYVINSLQKFKEKNQTNSIIEKQKYDNLKRLRTKTDNIATGKGSSEKFKRRIISINNVKDKTKVKGLLSSTKSYIDQSTKSPRRYDKSYEDDRFIPIKLRSPKFGHN
ncbi:unnamed protein product [Arctia plantaginis]|uniref:Uncharacterized protein n=1 Tax=Arctia plantaginis TaxID=874455 RepID=A0A8S1AGW7_ARCPL|nr:unnamed protein product [Arctia plantaginis]